LTTTAESYNPSVVDEDPHLIQSNPIQSPPSPQEPFWFTVFPIVIPHGSGPLRAFFVHWIANGHSGRLACKSRSPDIKPKHQGSTTFCIFDHGGETMQHQEHRYCKTLHQKNLKAWEQNNQSHPPSSVQVNSQCGCDFTRTQNLSRKEGCLFCLLC